MSWQKCVGRVSNREEAKCNKEETKIKDMYDFHVRCIDLPVCGIVFEDLIMRKDQLFCSFGWFTLFPQVNFICEVISLRVKCDFLTPQRKLQVSCQHLRHFKQCSLQNLHSDSSEYLKYLPIVI